MLSPTNSLERALELLETIEHSPGGLTNAETSRLLRIPKSSCSYILTILRRRGYLTRNEDTRRYKIGPAPIALGHGALRDMGFRVIGEPALYRLASDTGLSANIGVLERGKVLLVDRVESPRFVRDLVEAAADAAPQKIPRKLPVELRIRQRVERDIGRELPCDRSAIGNVLLAYLPESEVLSLINEHGVSCVTPAKIPVSTLMSQLANVRKAGYACAYGLYEERLYAIAAPIMDASGTVCAAVSVDGSSVEADWGDDGRLIELVKLAAQDITRRARLSRQYTWS